MIYVYCEPTTQDVDISTSSDTDEAVDKVVDSVVVQNDQVIDNLQEVLGDESFDYREQLQQIDNTLHIILVVILIVWAFNRLSAASRRFGSIGDDKK